MSRTPRKRVPTVRTYPQLLEYIQNQGYTIESGKHRRVIRPNGSLLMLLPSTPSDGKSGALNSLMSFKRAVRSDDHRN